MEYWERYPVVYLTPNSDWWDPNLSDFLEQEMAMLDADGYIVDRSLNGQLMIMDDVDVNLSALYVEPPTWDQIESVIGQLLRTINFRGAVPQGSTQNRILTTSVSTPRFSLVRYLREQNSQRICV